MFERLRALDVPIRVGIIGVGQWGEVWFDRSASPPASSV